MKWKFKKMWYTLLDFPLLEIFLENTVPFCHWKFSEI